MEIKRLIHILFLGIAPAALPASGAYVSIANYDFNDGFQGWAPFENTPWFEWRIVNIGDYSNASNSFSLIDPSDKASLYTDPPFNPGQRTHSWITSPEIFIDGKGEVSFYAGFSSSYDDACRLQLRISTDDFLTSSIIWNSKDEEGPASWRWHPVSISLADYEEKSVRFRFFYTTGSSDRAADRGGYMGDFAIDNFKITAEKSSPIPDPEPDPKPGPDPDDPPSTDPDNPDISDPDFPDEPEIPNLKPTAHIGFPSSFRAGTERLPFIPPHTPVVFRDNSEGDPNSVAWTFTGIAENPLLGMTVREKNPEITYSYTGDWDVSLISQNDYGVSMSKEKVTVQYETEISNLLPEDKGVSLSCEDGSLLPGSNTLGITAYAEKFDAPLTPALIKGVAVTFNNVQTAGQEDDFMSIGVHLYSSRNGLPNNLKASSYIFVGELPKIKKEVDQAYTHLFLFDEAQTVDNEFFIVIDGFPSLTNGNMVSFEMADPRQDHNTAFIKRKGVWEQSGILLKELGLEKFSTSYFISPQIAHSIFITDDTHPTDFKVDGNSGSFSYRLFSYLPLTKMSTDCDWLSLTSTEEAYDRIVNIHYKSVPSSVRIREGNIEIGDGLKSVNLHVTQDAFAGIDSLKERDVSFRIENGYLCVSQKQDNSSIEIYTPDGILLYVGIYNSPIDLNSFRKGLYIILINREAFKLML